MKNQGSRELGKQLEVEVGSVESMQLELGLQEQMVLAFAEPHGVPGDLPGSSTDNVRDRRRPRPVSLPYAEPGRLLG